MLLGSYKTRMNGDPRHYPRYCSRECQWESLRKSWREKSPYAQNIKRIRKEQHL
jgi:hypothetical protein